jgi:hypothetical protein
MCGLSSVEVQPHLGHFAGSVQHIIKVSELLPKTKKARRELTSKHLSRQWLEIEKC